MSKYGALGRFLREQRTAEVPMTFEEIERITGATLPPSAHKHRPWWSNNPQNSVMTRIWLDAGYETTRVNMAKRKLVFRRRPDGVRGGVASEGCSPPPLPRDGEQGSPVNRHPLFGATRGLVRIMPGTDLTEPADPGWAEHVEDTT